LHLQAPLIKTRATNSSHSHLYQAFVIVHVQHIETLLMLLLFAPALLGSVH